METAGTFMGLRWGPMFGPIMRLGPPNSAVSARTATVARGTRLLIEGQTYEVEGAVGATDEQASFAAAVQRTLIAISHLTPPIDPTALAGRVERLYRMEPVDIPILYVEGAAAEAHGVARHIGPPILEDPAPLRRAARMLRVNGWRGAMLFPGVAPESNTVLVPRSFLPRAQLRITHEETRQISAEVVEYTLGLGRSNGYPWRPTLVNRSHSRREPEQPTLG